MTLQKPGIVCEVYGLAVRLDMVKLLVDARLATSKQEAKRLLVQGAVEVNGRQETKRWVIMLVNNGASCLLRVGKHRSLRLVFPKDMIPDDCQSV